MTAAQLTTDLNNLEQLVQNASGTSTKPYFRAPMGETNTTVLATAGTLGYDYTIGWTVDTRDWSGTLTASQVSTAVVNNLTPGSIFLLHGNSSAATTPAALLEMVAAARALGYEFTTISGLLALQGIYPETPVDPDEEEPAEFIIPTLDDFVNVTNPIITRTDVTDVTNPLGTADPFIVLSTVKPTICSSKSWKHTTLQPKALLMASHMPTAPTSSTGPIHKSSSAQKLMASGLPIQMYSNTTTTTTWFPIKPEMLKLSLQQTSRSNGNIIPPYWKAISSTRTSSKSATSGI